MATHKKSREARLAKRGGQRRGARPIAKSLEQHLSTGAKDAAVKAAGVQGIAQKFPYNAAKPSESDAEAVEGEHHDPSDARVSASTLTESNTSQKTGTQARKGTNPASAPLDRVRVDSGGRVLTTNQGVAVGDNQNSLKGGLRGPALLQDFILREKITHFDHERIPERIVHARGSGAHGYFECLKPLTSLTSASLFAEAGKRTPVFVRFSTVAGERGSTDTARDVRGFAVKFYTDEGNWDLVGNNIPVFFIQDAMKFPDLIHAVKPEPHNAMPQAASAHDTFWDFVSLMPESTHMLLWVMSDRAIPRSFRMMQGFGVHTFRFVNAKGESRFVKFHWEPKAGTHSLVWDEAVKISGADSDFHRRDLWEAIESGAYPEWELGVQVFTEEQADKFSFDVLDATKLIPEELVPVLIVGRMVLNRNPDNFFAETEQVAFCTAHIVPGLDFSNDPLLAGRIHSYVDTQISRLGGPNFHELPINAPLAQVHNNQRDGMHRQAIPRGRIAYEPNSLGGGCPFQAGADGFRSFPQALQGDHVRAKPEKFAEHSLQAALFWESQSPAEQQHIIHAFRFELSKVQVPAIRARVVAQLRNVADALAHGVAAGLGLKHLPDPQPRAIKKLPRPEATRSPPLSLLARPGSEGINTRRIAILMSDGADTGLAARLRADLAAQGAMPKFVGVHMGTIDGSVKLDVDGSLEIFPSVLWDGAIVLDSAQPTLGANGQAVEFLKDQYRHCKTILLFGSATMLLVKLGLAAPARNGPVGGDGGLLSFNEDSEKEALVQFTWALARHRHFDRETDPPRI